MVKLYHFKPEDLSFLNYHLDAVQADFTASAASSLEKIRERNDTGDFNAFPVTVFENENQAGFFVLDFGNDKLELTENPKSVLARSFSVNPGFQGKGIGTSAMKLIPEFLKNNGFAETEEIVLAVNNKNTSAYQLYIKAGYEDYGKTRPWKSGFQHLLSMKIKSQK